MDKGLKKILIISGGIGVLIGIGVVVYTKRNAIKKLAKTTFGGQKWFDTGLKWYRHSKTKDIVEKLHPKARDKFKEFISRVEKELGLQIIATSGYRTFEHQARLKKQNPKNASAGNSSHNYGFALDVNVLDGSGKNILRKATSIKRWEDSKVVKIAKEMGFKWGGDFSNYHDPVHFYIEPLPRKDLLALHQKGEKDAEGYVLNKHINIGFDGDMQYEFEVING